MRRTRVKQYSRHDGTIVSSHLRNNKRRPNIYARADPEGSSRLPRRRQDQERYDNEQDEKSRKHNEIYQFLNNMEMELGHRRYNKMRNAGRKGQWYNTPSQIDLDNATTNSKRRQILKERAVVRYFDMERISKEDKRRKKGLLNRQHSAIQKTQEEIRRLWLEE